MSQFENDREQHAVGDGICPACGYETCRCEELALAVLDDDEPEPLTDALGRDPLDVVLEDAARMQERLRATRDTRAIEASNKNTRMLLDALKGHI